MALVTFLSDFGEEDHYVAAVKAALIQQLSGQVQIVDISHRIEAHDISHASYVLSNAYSHFPEGTIHLAGIEPHDHSDSDTLIAVLDGHYFVGGDTGLFTLLKKDQLPIVYKVNRPYHTFAALVNYVPVTVELAKGKKPETIGRLDEQYLRLFARQPKVTRREIVGNVIRVDHYGNLITNIPKNDFDTIRKINGEKSFKIQIGLQVFEKLHDKYDDVENGECYILFNEAGKLQFGINKGHGAKLLGLKFDSPVYIHFETE
ncbi:MAG: SAM hydrolase/SAM-dependent halogenase family protein [Cyclobacteriaceae bacterium]